jgi:hypothetical protein
MTYEITGYFKELYDMNKYLVKIYNNINSNWKIYIFKNNHIQVDIQTPRSLTSKHIDVDTIVEYINNQDSDIKISYTCYHDDFEEYKNKMEAVLENIKVHYANKGKTIHIKQKAYWGS